MSEALKTLEGSFCLHYFCSIDRVLWNTIDSDVQVSFLDDYVSTLAGWEKSTSANHTQFSIVGNKADWTIMITRPTMDELLLAEQQLQQLPFFEYVTVSYSYVSVVELSNYLSPEDGDPYARPEIRARLYPTLPEEGYICFYPMNKKREGTNNWYMLSVEERRAMMAKHGRIGRGYAGRVKQIISGSIGFDNWEWGVTLFSANPLEFKKLIYEMRFDEVSAVYGEFGDFFTGVYQNETEFRNFILG
ncbi:MAG: hydrogen peroxide-dependent heme synthase [Bacilli bacterium]